MNIVKAAQRKGRITPAGRHTAVAKFATTDSAGAAPRRAALWKHQEKDMSKELKELHDLLNREIEEMRRTGRSDISYILWDYETEDASDEVLDMCQAARKAHEAAFLEWQKAHPAEWAAVLKKADEDTAARLAADDYGAAIDAAYDSPF